MIRWNIYYSMHFNCSYFCDLKTVSMAIHTILGANGTIANELIPILQSNAQQIRLVSRNPKKVAGAELIQADILNRDAVIRAVNGSDIVYLLVGLKYDIKDLADRLAGHHAEYDRRLQSCGSQADIF